MAECVVAWKTLMWLSSTIDRLVTFKVLFNLEALQALGILLVQCSSIVPAVGSYNVFVRCRFFAAYINLSHIPQQAVQGIPVSLAAAGCDHLLQQAKNGAALPKPIWSVNEDVPTAAPVPM